MKILTVISNYNESSALKATIDDINKNSSIDSHLLVIDNSSNNDSIKIIKEANVDFLIHPVNTGGSAGVIKTALLFAHHHDYDIYCHMDGDNQHVAAELKKIVSPILQNEADFVVGSRFINKEGFQSHFFRRIGINLFSYIVSIISKNKLTDITSGFRAYNKKAIEYFAIKYKHEIEASVQMPLIASFAGLRISEVPVIMKPRLTGRSEINFINALKFPIFGTITLIGTLLQKH